MKLKEWEIEDIKKWFPSQMTGTLRSHIEEFHKEIKRTKEIIKMYENELKTRYTKEEFDEMKDWLKKEWYKFD